MLRRWSFVRSDKVDIFTACVWKYKFGIGKCRWTLAARARGAGGPTIFGAQHGPRTNTADLGHRSGNRRDPDKTYLAAALYRSACVHTDVQRPIVRRSTPILGWLTIVSLSLSHHALSNARYFRVFWNALKVLATFFILIFFIILYFIDRLITCTVNTLDQVF